jgi:hypothetical protein
VLVFLFVGGLVPMIRIEQHEVAGMSVTTFSLDDRLTG